MANCVSTIFASVADFEAWITKVKQLTDNDTNYDTVKAISPTDKTAWDNKGCNLSATNDGKLNLLCSNGEVLCSVDICHSDGTTIVRDSSTGAMTVKGFKAQNSASIFDIWVGTKANYDALESVDWTSRIYLITDNISTLNTLLEEVLHIKDGTTIVKKAECDKDGNEFSSTYYKKTETVSNATHAISADSATNATQAISAGSASHAVTAGDSTKVNNLEIKRNTNGVLGIGDTVITQKKLIYEGNKTIPTTVDGHLAVTISERFINYGERVEIIIGRDGLNQCVRGVFNGVQSFSIEPLRSAAIEKNTSTNKYEFTDNATLFIKVGQLIGINTIDVSCLWSIENPQDCVPFTAYTLQLKKIYKIIE